MTNLWAEYKYWRKQKIRNVLKYASSKSKIQESIVIKTSLYARMIIMLNYKYSWYSIMYLLRHDCKISQNIYIHSKRKKIYLVDGHIIHLSNMKIPKSLFRFSPRIWQFINKN